MTRTHEYHVAEVGTSIAGDRLFTVVERVDGVARGGDHRWVRARYAARAADVYSALAAMSLDDMPASLRMVHHGSPSDMVDRAHRVLFGSPMFDPD